MERKIVISVGEFYHLYNRGVNKLIIFLSDKDRERFVRLLFLCNSKKTVVYKTVQGRTLEDIDRGETVVDIVAYCLMPNHFHILVKEKKEGGTSFFMSKLMTAYSMYFNKNNERSGPLFESRYKVRHANKDEYLKYLFSYIHLNPVKIIDPQWKENGIKDKDKSKKYLNNYKYSSYVDYAGIKRPESNILNMQAAPDYFEDQFNFDNNINDWLSYKE